MNSETKKLWFDGPNYTADAVVVDTDTNQILLIRRKDTGDWALPGGFVEPDELPDNAARREAYEEANARLLGAGVLVYHGIVNDPRNTQDAWIETSAYLFDVPSDDEVTGGDDASDARWFDFDSLPPLYASHADIVGRALGHLAARISEIA